MALPAGFEQIFQFRLVYLDQLSAGVEGVGIESEADWVLVYCREIPEEITRLENESICLMAEHVDFVPIYFFFVDLLRCVL